MVVTSTSTSEAEIVSLHLDLNYRLRLRPDSSTTPPCSSSFDDYVPKIRSGSHSDIGPRPAMEDCHFLLPDLSSHFPDLPLPAPASFFALFDGHGGPHAASFLSSNAITLFFPTPLSHLLLLSDTFHRTAFLSADLALAHEPSVSPSCGTTALTAFLLGNRLLVANAGDCRAVLCRKGLAIDMSHDHRPSFLPERARVEQLGAFIFDGYLNGSLSVTRALGDWEMKSAAAGSLLSPLIAEPELQHAVLTEDDEFLIMGCDGIWDVMSSQYAVSLVRRGLRRHDDPQQCARELVREAIRLNTGDNLTVIVICFASPSRVFDPAPRRSRFRGCSLSEESRSRLKGLLEGN